MLLVWLAVIMPTPAARAQFGGGIGIGVAAQPPRAVVGRELVYRIGLTNLEVLPLLSVVVTNRLPEGSEFVGLQTNAAVLSFTNTAAGTLLIRLRDLPISGVASLAITSRPTILGLVTNIVTVAAPGTAARSATNVAEVVGRSSDLVVFTGLADEAPLSGRPLTQRIAVTNLGPEEIAQATVTNAVPSGAAFARVEGGVTNGVFAGGVLSVTLGRLAAGAGTAFDVVYDTVAADTLVFTAGVTGVGGIDPSPTNNMSTVTARVTETTPGTLSAAAAAGALDPQTGLIRQVVRVRNDGAVPVSGARIVVTGLTNRLVNAAGTRFGIPFVTLSAGVAPGGTAELVLEYFSPTRRPVAADTLGLQTIPIIPPATDAPVVAGPDVTRVALLPGGSVLVEFASTPGRRYRIAYAAGPGFTNAPVAVPDIVAEANRVQWIDDGPPKTASRPAGIATRFYRVQEVTP